MRLGVSISFDMKGIPRSELKRIVDQSKDLYSSRVAEPPPTGGVFSVSDILKIQAMKSAYAEFLPKNRAPFEVLIFRDIRDEVISSNGLGVLPRLGVDKSGFDSMDSGDVSSASLRVTCCENCGNRFEDPEKLISVSVDVLDSEHGLFSFFPGVTAFCTREFLRHFESSKLNGVTFTPLKNQGHASEPVFRFDTIRHTWKDRTGVCPLCEMKTNVRYEQFFNLPETFDFDFQKALTFTGFSYVVSRAGLKFLTEFGSTPISRVTAPLLPGYEALRIQPEPRFFSRGSAPTESGRPWLNQHSIRCQAFIRCQALET